MLILLPMWMNFLLRTYAMMSLMEDSGIINQILKRLGLQPLSMIGTEGAVLTGMVYNFVAVMILPIYTALKKMDERIIEAAEIWARTRSTYSAGWCCPFPCRAWCPGLRWFSCPR